MRAFPTRRGFIILALVVFSALFLRLGLSILQISHDSASEWSSCITIPWGTQSLPGVAKNSLDASRGDGKESAFFWHKGKVPTTEIRAHVPGWTVFEKLYLLKGTVFVVTDEPSAVPDRKLLTSSGYPLLNSPEDVAKRLPTDIDMQIINSSDAAQLFGLYAARLEGTSYLLNDPPQFIAHYYHWAAEVFFGLWRMYSLLDPHITSDGRTTLPLPRRLIMSHIPAEKWRDRTSMNPWVTRGAFPSISIEYKDDWDDRASMSHPFLLDRVVFSDRAAASHSPSYHSTRRPSADLFDNMTASPHWWSPIRKNLLEFAGEDPQADWGKVITYVSRQGWGRRMLLPEDHDRLVKALEGLREKHGYEVNIVSMDKLSRQEQFRLAGRTTILMGVHGNALTSLLWMKPSRRTTVMEFFFPGGFTYDYQWPTRSLGMKHYGFWGNEHFTYPDLPPVKFPAGFQGNEIPLDADLVARLCHERLSLPEK